MDPLFSVLSAVPVAFKAVVLFRKANGGAPQKGRRITSTAGRVLVVLALLAVVAVGLLLLQAR